MNIWQLRRGTVSRLQRRGIKVDRTPRPPSPNKTSYHGTPHSLHSRGGGQHEDGNHGNFICQLKMNTYIPLQQPIPVPVCPIFPCKVHDIDGLLYHECCAKGCSLGIAAWVLHQFTWSDWKAMSSAPCVFVQRILKSPSCMQSQRGFWCWCIWCLVGARLRSQAFKSGGWSSYHGRAVKTVEWILSVYFGIKTVTLWAVFFNGDLLPFFYFGKEAATGRKEKQV
jgi:hypothetical protein